MLFAWREESFIHKPRHQARRAFQRRRNRRVEGFNANAFSPKSAITEWRKNREAQLPIPFGQGSYRKAERSKRRQSARRNKHLVANVEKQEELSKSAVQTARPTFVTTAIGVATITTRSDCVIGAGRRFVETVTRWTFATNAWWRTANTAQRWTNAWGAMRFSVYRKKAVVKTQKGTVPPIVAGMTVMRPCVENAGGLVNSARLLCVRTAAVAAESAGWWYVPGMRNSWWRAIFVNSPTASYASRNGSPAYGAHDLQESAFRRWYSYVSSLSIKL